MSIPEKLVVAAIVKTKSEASDGYAIELEIASFNSQYPTKVTRVPEALAAQLKSGQAANLNLIRQRIKNKSDGTPRTGTYPTDFYWGLEGIAGNAPTQQTQGQPLQQPPNPVHPNTPVRDFRDESIKQQVAVKEVGAMLCAGKPVSEALTRGYWSVVTEWLYAGITPLSNPPSTPQSAPPATGEIFWPTLKNWGELLTRASKNYLNSDAVFKILDVTELVKYQGTPDDAWLKIAAAKDLKPETAKL